MLYDRIGEGYRTTRRADPRIAARIHAALGDARTVLNVGAGTGNYEPEDREVTAVEPSETMIAQRPPGSAAVVRASAEIAGCLGGADSEPIPVPADCADGFLGAWWRQPEAYLDPNVRAGISVFAQLDPAEVEDCVERLGKDLVSGAWHARHGDLLAHDELDLGYRLLVASRASPAA